MFVTSNTIQAIKTYFNTKLCDNFSNNEIKFMFEVCVEKRLGITKSELLLNHDVRLSESDLLYFRSIANRLLENEPFQYIIGETYFYGLTFSVNPSVLIPRPETEELVDLITKKYNPSASLKIVDICTGSACIALALKSVLKEAQVIATDVSIEALNVAKKNSHDLNLSVKFIHNDVLNDELEITKGSIDVIVSNPPYIPEQDKLEMASNVLDFEPSLALFVPDNDPLIFYRKITKIASELLVINGLLAFELHERFADETKEMIETFGFENIQIIQDLQGKNRMLFATKK